jgi:hypothetical protein
MTCVSDEIFVYVNFQFSKFWCLFLNHETNRYSHSTLLVESKSQTNKLDYEYLQENQRINFFNLFFWGFLLESFPIPLIYNTVSFRGTTKLKKLYKINSWWDKKKICNVTINKNVTTSKIVCMIWYLISELYPILSNFLFSFFSKLFFDS